MHLLFFGSFDLRTCLPLHFASAHGMAVLFDRFMCALLDCEPWASRGRVGMYITLQTVHSSDAAATTVLQLESMQRGPMAVLTTEQQRESAAPACPLCGAIQHAAGARCSISIKSTDHLSLTLNSVSGCMRSAQRPLSSAPHKQRTEPCVLCLCASLPGAGDW